MGIDGDRRVGVRYFTIRQNRSKLLINSITFHKRLIVLVHFVRGRNSCLIEKFLKNITFFIVVIELLVNLI